ncbi:ESX secretion-associated protein EspG [Amycolatopsis sp. BJA-103]|uniref:ESX secretion-associated protein EspG n=1 Tax=Amycolatopsis sp. BJA-103 TaxID=1911175 RepID=UPI000C78DCC6|nr:ESX secretion-associated protein EspG [Amycolatopsis sp. BJA-103]AUI59591.1 hypothetical protein BKN51_16095 [Amycolatopsis sp. BJA-103]PNE16962.1 hypothetical protein B1H26_18415 [Amycolatopsis sp. BJA-103]
MAIDFGFTLDRVQVTVLGYAFGVQVTRYPLTLPRIDPDPVRLLHTVTVANILLRKRRLCSSGGVNARVRAAFGLFADARVEIALTGVTGTGDQFGVLGLSDGRQALIVEQADRDSDVGFRLLPDEDWVDELACHAPSMPAGHGRELVFTDTLPVSRSAFAARRAREVDEDAAETRQFEQDSVMSMVRPPQHLFHGHTRTDRETAAGILAGERLGSGRLLVTGRGRGPSGRRHTDPVAWFDTAAGRYLLYSSTSEGTATVRLRPGGTRELAHCLRDAVGTVY